MCSFPSCRRLTVGPSEDRKSGLSNVGIAAHITAASLGGPRYDASLSAVERSSERNGVWMCQTHSKLIDDNPNEYPVSTIVRWKKQHEEWVFSRIANAENHTRNGVARVALSGLGPFRAKVEIKLGRNNVILGLNNSGKSTLCEAIAALSGGSNFKEFVSRFRFCQGNPNSPFIEVGVARNDLLTTVRLSQQELLFHGRRTPRGQRLHVEVNGHIATFWPQSLFNVILIDDIFGGRDRLKSPLRTAIRWLAEQLRTSEHSIWDSLREENFLTSALGYRFRRSGTFMVDVLVPDGRGFYLPFGNLSCAERNIAVLDILLKLLQSDPRSAPWFLIFDTLFFSTLDAQAKKSLVDRLNALEEPALQTIVCVNYEKDAELLKAANSDYWIGATSAGELTIHSFL